MMNITAVAAAASTTATPPVNEGARWLRRHLAWERTMHDCVEHSLDGQLDAPAPGDQSTDGTSAHNRSSS